MLSLAEKRSFPRMDIECPASIVLTDDVENTGAIVKNLSGGGVLMWLEQPVEAGRVLVVEIMPLNNITPPMKARVKVLRCSPVEGLTGQFALGCEMEQILG